MSGLVAEVLTARRLPPPALAKAVRVAAGVSQARVARELGVTRVTVARWEAGARRPRGLTLHAYVDLLEALREAAA